MKKLLSMIIAILALLPALWSCVPKNEGPDPTLPPEPVNTEAPVSTSVPETKAPGKLTMKTACRGVSIYCQIECGYRPTATGSKNGTLIIGDETDGEFLFIYRSYTGSRTKFFVDKATGSTRVVEYVPVLDTETEAGSFDLYDYLGREVPTPEPTPAPTPEPERFVFRPKVRSHYMEEVFGETMCDTWDNLVDAVMAGENTFACPDKHTYDWVMGQFPNRYFPVLVELIDLAYDRNQPVVDGVASFTWLVPPEEAAVRIAEFAKQVEDLLNEVMWSNYSDFEKALALYDHFSRSYTYDYDTFDKMYESYVDYLSAYRFMSTGTGICCEISTAYSYLLMQAGVEATTMMGDDHEWSYVYINGSNYHIDPTFVLGADSTMSYFMMTDEQREASGFPRDEFVITSNYSQDNPHPDYAADDARYSVLWDYAFNELFPDGDKLSCWRYTEGWRKEYMEFDYSGL